VIETSQKQELQQVKFDEKFQRMEYFIRTLQKELKTSDDVME